MRSKLLSTQLISSILGNWLFLKAVHMRLKKLTRYLSVVPSINRSNRAGFSDMARRLTVNGNATCFSWQVNDAMCPSYKATKDKSLSPKGRAAMLREWARLQSGSPESTLIPPLEGELYRSLNACLSCKSCSYSLPPQGRYSRAEVIVSAVLSPEAWAENCETASSLATRSWKHWRQRRRAWRIY